MVANSYREKQAAPRNKCKAFAPLIDKSNINILAANLRSRRMLDGVGPEISYFKTSRDTMITLHHVTLKLFRSRDT